MLLTSAIDWTQETVTLLTNSGVEHYPCPKDQVTAHKITIDQQWNPRGYEIADRGEYLSIMVFGLSQYNLSARATTYKNYVKQNGNPGLQVKSSCNYTQSPTIVSRQLRIYKDKTAVLVSEIQDPDDQHRYLMVGDDVALLTHFLGRTIVSKTDPDYQHMCDTLKPVVVTSDAEIKAHAQKITNKRKTAYLKYFLRFTDSDLNSGAIRYISNLMGERYALAIPTRDMVNNFFEVTAEKNKDCVTEFHRKTHVSTIVDVTDIFTWCQCKNKPSAATTAKQNRLEHYLNMFKEEIGAADKYANYAVWNRDGDEICACCLNPSTAWGGSYIVGVNVVTQKKMYINFKHSSDGTVTDVRMNIPDPASMIYVSYYTFNNEIRMHACHNGTTLEEVFKGTGIMELIQRHPRWRVGSRDDSITTIDQCMAKNVSCFLFSAMFVNLGMPIANLLKDNGLDNLYYHYLKHTGDFEMTDKNGVLSNNGYNLDTDLLLCRPGSTLDEVFNMPLEKLQILNQYIQTEHNKTNWCGMAKLQYYVPQQLNAISADDFKKMCLRIGSINEKAHRPLFNRTIKYLLCDDRDQAMADIRYYILKFIEGDMGADWAVAHTAQNKYDAYYSYLAHRTKAREAGVATAANLPLFPDGTTRDITFPYIASDSVNAKLGINEDSEVAQQNHVITLKEVDAYQEANLINDAIPFGGYTQGYNQMFVDLYDEPTQLVFYEPTMLRMMENAIVQMGYNPTLALTAIINQNRYKNTEDVTHLVFIRKDGSSKPFLMMEIEDGAIQVIRGPNFKELKDFKAQKILAKAIIDWAADFKIDYTKVIPITMLIDF